MATPNEIRPVVRVQAKTELDRIYNDSGTAYALDLFGCFGKKALNEEGFKGFLDGLPPEAAQERAKIEKLIADPSARVDADLSTRTGQLAWAAALGFAFQSNPPGTIRSHAIWRTLTRNPQLSGSLGAAARYVDMAVTNRNATMDWGTPGSWFWFAPDKNHINIDLFHTLLCGFGEDPAPGIKGLAHATGVMMHEVGHSQLTTRWTDKMTELLKREQELLEESKTRKLTRDEFKELARVRTEFSLRMNVMNAAEDNCVNRYAAGQSREFPHDFGESLNMANVLLQGSGYYLKSKELSKGGHSDFSEILEKLMGGSRQREIKEAEKALTNLSKALMLSFYVTNGLFDRDDVDTWKRLGVDPDEIRAENSSGAGTAADKFLGRESDFERLIQMNIGTNGIANLQPSGRDRWLLQSVFARSVQTYADRRCRIIEEIWDQYAARYAKILIDAAEQNAENRMNQKQQGNKNDGQQQNGQGNGSGSSSGQENVDDPALLKVAAADKAAPMNKKVEAPALLPLLMWRALVKWILTTIRCHPRRKTLIKRNAKTAKKMLTRIRLKLSVIWRGKQSRKSARQIKMTRQAIKKVITQENRPIITTCQWILALPREAVKKVLIWRHWRKATGASSESGLTSLSQSLTV